MRVPLVALILLVLPGVIMELLIAQTHLALLVTTKEIHGVRIPLVLREEVMAQLIGLIHSELHETTGAILGEQTLSVRREVATVLLAVRTHTAPLAVIKHITRALNSFLA